MGFIELAAARAGTGARQGAARKRGYGGRERRRCFLAPASVDLARRARGGPASCACSGCDMGRCSGEGIPPGPGGVPVWARPVLLPRLASGTRGRSRWWWCCGLRKPGRRPRASSGGGTPHRRDEDCQRAEGHEEVQCGWDLGPSAQIRRLRWRTSRAQCRRTTCVLGWAAAGLCPYVLPGSWGGGPRFAALVLRRAMRRPDVQWWRSRSRWTLQRWLLVGLSTPG